MTHLLDLDAQSMGILGDDGSGGGAAISSLLTGLDVYWKLDNSWIDEIDSYTLTPVAGATFTASGKINQAGAFVRASSQYSKILDNAALSVGVGNPFTISAWFYPASIGISQTICSKWGATNEYLIDVETTNKVKFYGYNGSTQQIVQSNIAISATTWYHVLVWYDPDTGLMYVSVNQETPQTGALANGIQDGTNVFNIGSFNNGSYLWNGYIDEVAKWSRVLTSEERGWLYNGGSGLQYPF